VEPAPAVVRGVVPLRVHVQLDVVAARAGLLHALLPLPGQPLERGIVGPELQVIELLHHLGIEGRLQAVSLVDVQKGPHAVELDPAHVSGAVAAQIPVISQNELHPRHGGPHGRKETAAVARASREPEA